MTTRFRTLALALILVGSPAAAWAQTVDEIIEKSIAAMGGRAAMEKITSRSVAGTITLATPAGEIAGTIEILNAVPNKAHVVVKADLTALGAGPMTIEQRFDGSAGYILDTLQGNREMDATQLAVLKNGSFPHPFLKYKESNAAKLGGKEKVGAREAYLIIFEPKSGPTVRQYIDASTFLPMQVVMKLHVPQIGSEVEETTEFLDWRDVDGLKVPFRIQASSAIQGRTIVVTKVTHNVPVDDKLFVKPAAQ